MIKIGSSITIYPDRKMATAAAVANQADDETWTYSVQERHDGKFIVQIYDEDAEFVGCL